VLRDAGARRVYIEIVTVKDVAEYLNVTERISCRLAAARKIPAFKVGGS
jgi:excisionase family DNA binding protein